MSDSDEDWADVQGYDGLAMIDGKVQLVAPVEQRGKLSCTRTRNPRFEDSDWYDNDVTTSEDERKGAV